MASAVADAGPLIHLSEIGQLRLLNQFSPLVVPERILAEVRSVRSLASIRITRVRVTASSRRRLSVAIRDRLDSGELDCLAFCREQTKVIFLTDDLDAREAAQRMGIETHGSVGIIVRAVRSGLINRSEATAALRLMDSTSSLFITRQIIEMAIERLRESK